MNKFSVVLAVAAPIFLNAGLAQAQWYVGADGGVNFLQGEDITGKQNDGTTFTDKSGNKTGYAVQMHGGYNFGGPKAEFEVGYRGATLKSLAEVSGKVSGETTSLSLMTNGVYEFLPNSKWHPFVGAGVGMARVGADWKVNGNRVLNDSDWVFAYQGFAGVAYDIDKNWGVNAQYRYFATQDAKLTDGDGGTAEFGYHSHAILAGVTYKLGK